MQSTPYYLPKYPKYSLSVSAEQSRQSFSAIRSISGPHSKVHDQGDTLDTLLSGRLKVIEAGIEQILEEIHGRETLHDSLLYDIDRDLCEQKERLYQVAPHGSSPFTVGDSKRRASIEKELAALKAEKRTESGGLWKDVATLKKELRELLREYEEEKRRQQVIAP
jgi:hypothetical protein